jgi:hypothetical protein
VVDNESVTAKMLSCCSLDASIVVGCKLMMREMAAEIRLIFIGISEGHWFVVYIEIGDQLGTITYYIPLLSD